MSQIFYGSTCIYALISRRWGRVNDQHVILMRFSSPNDGKRQKAFTTPTENWNELVFWRTGYILLIYARWAFHQREIELSLMRTLALRRHHLRQLRERKNRSAPLNNYDIHRWYVYYRNGLTAISPLEKSRHSPFIFSSHHNCNSETERSIAWSRRRTWFLLPLDPYKCRKQNGSNWNQQCRVCRPTVSIYPLYVLYVSFAWKCL